MRVGDKTNHNRLRISIETDGTISPRESLEKSIAIMIEQLNAILDFKPAPKKEVVAVEEQEESPKAEGGAAEDQTEILKTRIDNLNLSTRTLNALESANIRTIGGIAKKKKEDLLKIEGIGDKGIQEIKRILSNYGITLK
jgi:DNA-directed RNA polymerase subunit alpha